MIKLFIFAKKLHRITMYSTVLLIFIMGISGTIMKFEDFFEQFDFINLRILKYIHSEMSIYFSIALAIMTISGVYMYIFPLLKKKSLPNSS